MHRYQLWLRATTLTCIAAFATGASAQISDDVVRIGFITDLSGLYADYDGPGGAEAIRMAIADMGGAINDKKIELLVADHHNKADASAKAREWFDNQKLDMLVGGTSQETEISDATLITKSRSFSANAWPGAGLGASQETPPK